MNTLHCFGLHQQYYSILRQANFNSFKGLFFPKQNNKNSHKRIKIIFGKF